jgi:hypothetical protein
MQTVFGVMPDKDKDQALKDRIEARKRELQMKYDDLKADTGNEAAEKRGKLKRELEELETHLKDGWEKVSDTVRSKLDKWLRRDHH